MHSPALSFSPENAVHNLAVLKDMLACLLHSRYTHLPVGSTCPCLVHLAVISVGPNFLMYSIKNKKTNFLFFSFFALPQHILFGVVVKQLTEQHVQCS